MKVPNSELGCWRRLRYGMSLLHKIEHKCQLDYLPKQKIGEQALELAL